ncbi:ribonuclease H-like domain-containing protein, partial [Tanacetum coccineum]
MEEINNFQQEPDETLYQAWERFKELLMKCPQHYLTEMQEVILFYNGLDVPSRQILDSMTFAEEKIGKRKLRKIIDISSDSSDDRRWAAKKASAPVFYGPSTQGLLDAYGYNTIEEYLSWNYFPSTDNESTDMETTDKRNTDKDCIVDSNSAMSKGSVLVLPNVTTWDEIEKKIGARKSKTCAYKAKGKRKECVTLTNRLLWQDGKLLDFRKGGRRSQPQHGVSIEIPAEEDNVKKPS